MTQVFFTTASTSPWAVPADFQASGGADLNGSVGTFGSSIIFGFTSGIGQIAETFTTGSNNTVLASIDLKLTSTNTPADSLSIAIYAGTPASFGALIGTSDSITVNTGTPTVFTFTFAGGLAISPSTQYTAVIQRSAPTGATWYSTLIDTDTFASGDAWGYNNVSGWFQYTVGSDGFNDFYIYFRMYDHTVEMISAGGDGRIGTTGTSGRGGGGGGGGGYSKLTYASGTITPGSTTIAFVVGTHGTSASATTSQWAGTGGANCYLCPNGGTSGGTAGGAGGGGLTTAGTPPITYTTTVDRTGGAGGSAASGSIGGGGGGGGAAGPAAAGGGGASPAGAAAGGGGGGANNGSSGTVSGQLGGQGSSGTGGSSGNPGGNGTGNSGGAGSNTVSTAITTTGGNGGSGTDFDGTHGCGGGAGGSGNNSANVVGNNKGGNGGSYGGGGGGCGSARGTSSTFTAGIGGNGLTVVTYVPGAVGDTLTMQTLVMM